MYSYVNSNYLHLEQLLAIATFSLWALTTLKPFTVWITINCGKFLKRWGYQTTWLASWFTCVQVEKQEYTEGLYKKGLNDLDKHSSVITHLESYILEYEVKWALGSITTNKDDGISAELFKTLKDNAVKVLYSICQEIWKIQQWSKDWKRWAFIPSPKRAMPKNVQMTTQLHSSHMLAK